MHQSFCDLKKVIANDKGHISACYIFDNLKVIREDEN